MNRRGIILLALLTGFLVVSAEEPDSLTYYSPSTFGLMPVLNPWLNSSNPAGHSFDPAVAPGKMELNYRGEKGPYKRVQQGEEIQQYSLRTERYKRINKISFYGDFSYDKSYEKGVRYSNINDPYRGTPYLLIDTSGRYDIYDREFFTLRGDMALPVFRFLSWGFSADMNAGLSSQDRDPRPRNKVLNLDLSQGLLFSTPHVSLGVNALYSYYNEDIEIDIIEKFVHLAFFQLHGMDSYTYHVASSFNRLYKRNTYGGEGQLSLNVGGLHSLFGTKFLYINERVFDGRKAGNASWSYLKDDSHLEGNELEIFNATSFSHGPMLHSLSARYRMRHMVGAEILQRLEQVGEAGAVDWVDYGQEEKYASRIYDLGIAYSFLILERGFARNLQLDLGVDYLGSEQAYYLPDMDESYQNRIFSAAVRKSFFMGRHEIGLGTGMKLKQNLNASQTFDESGLISGILLLPDFEYLTSDYRAPWLEASYAVSMKRLFDKYFIRTNIAFYRGSNDMDRTIFNFSTGVIFKN
jgi:hypothetical protein